MNGNKDLLQSKTTYSFALAFDPGMLPALVVAFGNVLGIDPTVTHDWSIIVEKAAAVILFLIGQFTRKTQITAVAGVEVKKAAPMSVAILAFFLVGLAGCVTGPKLDTVDKKFAAAYKTIQIGYSTLEKVVRTKKPDGTPLLTRAQAQTGQDCIDSMKKALDNAYNVTPGLTSPDVTVADKVSAGLNLLITALDAAIGGGEVKLSCATFK
jgi:hypothetical protein